MSTLINIDNRGTQADICVIRDDEVFHAKALTTPYPKDTRIAELEAEVARLRGE